MADQHGHDITTAAERALTEVCELAIVRAAETVNAEWRRRWDDTVPALQARADLAVAAVARVQALADRLDTDAATLAGSQAPGAVGEAAGLARAAYCIRQALDGAGTPEEHDVEISVGPDGVGWACGICAWVGRGLGSEQAERQEHDQIAADIASGKLPAADTSEPAGRLELTAGDASAVVAWDQASVLEELLAVLGPEPCTCPIPDDCAHGCAGSRAEVGEALRIIRVALGETGGSPAPADWADDPATSPDEIRERLQAMPRADVTTGGPARVVAVIANAEQQVAELDEEDPLTQFVPAVEPEGEAW